MNDAEIPDVVQREVVTNPVTAGEKKLVATVQQVNSEGAKTATEEKIYLYAAQTAYEETKKYTGVTELGQLVLEATQGTVAGDSNAEKFMNKKVEAVKEESKNVATAFETGKGTESDPYIITCEEEFKNITKITKTDKVWYKLGNDITVNGDESYYAYAINIVLDLDGKTLSASSGTSGRTALIKVEKEIELYNGIIIFDGGLTVFADASINNTIFEAHDLVFQGNVNITNGYHYGLMGCYLGNSDNNPNQYSILNFTDIDIWTNIKFVQYTGGVLGYTRNTKTTLENINVYSSIQAGNLTGGIVMASGSAACGYGANNINANCGFDSVNNVAFYGTIVVPTNINGYYFGSNLPSGKVDNDFKGSNASIIKAINIDNDIIVSDGNEFKINTNASYTKYVVIYSFNADNPATGAGGYPITIQAIKDNNGDAQINTGIYKYKVVDGGAINSSTDIVVEGCTDDAIFTRNGVNNTYLYNNASGLIVSPSCSTVVTVYAYNNEVLKAVGSYCYIAK